jgi:hypothetical protein
VRGRLSGRGRRPGRRWRAGGRRSGPWKAYYQRFGRLSKLPGPVFEREF